MHRDLPQERGQIGTVVWYPSVDGGNMVGADRPGYNQALEDVNCRTSLYDFLQPRASFFIKDLFIVAVSERSPVED